MQISAWATLFRYLPPALHNALVLSTRAGVEIQMQGLLRVDHEFVAIRGRLSGTQDGGRFLFVPYTQIDYIGFQKEAKDAEFHELFDGLKMPAPDAFQVIEEVVEEIAPDVAPEAAPLVQARIQKVPCIKSAVLERFRSRGAAPVVPASPG